MQNEQVELTLHGSAPGQRKHINGKAATGEFHSVSMTFSSRFLTFLSHFHQMEYRARLWG